ncbi:MAG: glycosyltransferase family 2 protein [Ilumatobacteraceae bacterium]
MGRTAGVSALAVGAAYLAWRLATFGGAPWWLGAPALAVEAIGWLACAILVWALWSRPDPATAHDPGLDGTPVDVEVVVRCLRADPGALRATLLSATPVGPVLVVDPHASPDLATLAVGFGARYLATDTDDVDGIRAAAELVATDAFVVIDAGDVVHPRVLDLLAPCLADPRVAVVQGAVTGLDGDSAEHGGGGRHDLQFDRHLLVPALGSRGVAPYGGSGALVRTRAICGIDVVRSAPETVAADVTTSLFAAGWRIVACTGQPVVAAAPLTSPIEVEDARARQASAARHLLLGRLGAWRPNHLSLTQRLSLTAQAVRPLSGLRRAVVVVLLAGVVLSGRVPFEPDARALAALWAPWFVLSAVALHLLSAGELRPGDRVRTSMRLLGASWRGVFAPDGRPDPARHVLGGAFGLHHGVAPALAIAAISVVIGLRALSDRVTHTLAAMPSDVTAGVLLVALWSLAGGLDALRILARRAQTRRATRIASSLPSTFADRASLVVDLTPLGAGVLGDADLTVGSRRRLDVVLPTTSGVVSASVDAIVRNVRIDFSGEQRFGVEFVDVDGYVADALAEYCVLQPAYESLGAGVAGATPADVRPVVVLDDQPALPRRMGLRAAALVAVAGAVASAVPSGEASASPGGRISGSIEVATGGALVPPSTTGPGADGVAPDDTADLIVVTTVTTQAPTTQAPNTTATSTASTSTASTTGSITPAPTTPSTPPAPTTAPDDTSDLPRDTSDLPGDPTGTDVVAASAAAAAAGTVVVVVCSVAAGGDGAWGTADDDYTAPVSTVVDADGSWSVDIGGGACWAAVAPPPGFMVRGETSDLESPTSPQPLDVRGRTAPRVEVVRTTETVGAADPSDTPAAEVVLVDDVVWGDDDGDRVLDVGEPFVAGVTVHLVDEAGTVRGADVSDADGRFSIPADAGRAYRLVVSNLPAGYLAPEVFGRSDVFVLDAGSDVDLSVGLRPPTTDAATPGPGSSGASTALVVADGDAGEVGPAITAPPARLLEAPAGNEVGDAPSSPGMGSWLVVVLATLIGVSVLAGSLRPARPAVRPVALG